MKRLQHLFDNNQKWSRELIQSKPEFLSSLASIQNPKYLWIGCSDSRVPANEICGLNPGELFVHRNVANLVVHTDMNCLSVVQYAIEVIKVTDIIICGHYGCGGVKAALSGERLGLIDNWLRNIKDVHYIHRKELDKLPEGSAEKLDRLCELNVKEQVANLCHSTIVQEAWHRGQDLTVHGWIYGLQNGQIKDLDFCFSNLEQLHAVHRYGHIVADENQDDATP